MGRILVHRGGARFEALNYPDDDPKTYDFTELASDEALRWRKEGNFRLVQPDEFDREMHVVSEAQRKSRHAGRLNEAVLRKANPEGTAYEALEYSKAEPTKGPTRTQLRPEQLERWREQGGFRDVSDEEWRQHLNRSRGVEEAESHLRVAPDFALDEEVPGVRGNIAPALDVRASESTSYDRPARDEEYAAAQSEEDNQRRLRALGELGAGINRAITGVDYDKAAYQEPEGANPVKRLLAQREMDKKARLSDPSSPESKRLQAAVASAMPGAYTPQQLATIAAEDADYVTDFVRVRSAAEARAAAAKEAARRAAEDRAARENEGRMNREATLRAAGITAAGKRTEAEMDRDLKRELAAMEAGNKSAGKIVTSMDAGEIGQADAAISALEDLDSAFAPSGAEGLGGMIQAALPWDSDPKRFSDKVLATAQAVGVILEGGKLAAGDEVKYRKMLPAPGDSVGRAKAKIENVKKLVRDAQRTRIQGLGAAGYNTSGFQQGGGGAPAPAPQRGGPQQRPAQAAPLPPPTLLPNGKRAKRVTMPDGSVYEETADGGTKRIK